MLNIIKPRPQHKSDPIHTLSSIMVPRGLALLTLLLAPAGLAFLAPYRPRYSGEIVRLQINKEGWRRRRRRLFRSTLLCLLLPLCVH